MASRTEKMSPRARRHQRVRAVVHGTDQRPRLVVFRSLRYMYAQIIDDTTGTVVAAANDRDLKDVKVPDLTAKVAHAYAVGQKVAELAKAKKVTTVAFDRGGYRYHGRVKAVAEGARSAGLEF